MIQPRRFARLSAGLLAGLSVCALAAPASADTLREALAAAYNTNPTLQAARAQQRAVDENVPIEKAAGLPNANGTATHIEFLKSSDNSFSAPDRSLSAGLDLGVPIYSGGAVKNAVRAAQQRVDAGQADLRGTESAIFSQVVAAYMEVIRSEALVGLSRNQVDVLSVNFQATSDRFQIGDLTRTDVAQSEARLAIAQTDLRASESNLVAARERYIELVGNPPGDLEAPPPLPGLPDSADEAVAIAIENNPDLIAARERVDASEFDVRVAGASRLPRVSVFAGSDYSNYYGTLGGAAASELAQSETTASAGVQLSVPIFQGGRPAALRRQAQARSSVALEQEIAAERAVIADVRAAYSSWRSANAIIQSSLLAVDAAELGLEGVRAENTVGNRTILDILDAQRELLSTQVQLVTARRNAYVAGFSLLAAMGRAEARDLNLDTGGPLYDPQVNYDRVKNIWFDWGNDPAPVLRSTSTIDTEPQDGEIASSDIGGS
ncbi:TolC family outer membrane protein [Altererythrobacter sp. CAU 1778]